MSHDEILMIKVLIIIPEGGMLFEAAGIAEILSHASRTGRFTGGEEAYQVSITAGKSNTAVKGFSGIRLSVNHHLSDLSVNADWDTIIVTGRGMDKDERRLIANWLRQAEPYARRVVSICGGSLLLAESGLLDGRKATTHWQLLDVLKTGFPNVKVDEDSIYTRDGKIWTSAGVSAGFDLTLALIEEDYGFQHARSVAQDMVMFLKRPGGQSQFSRYVVNQAVQPGPVRDLQVWILENLAENLTIDSLASRVSMSPRNFVRVFTRETGTTPAKYVEAARLDAARALLEQSPLRIEQVATITGFKNVLKMRRAFERGLKLTPSEYRQRFGAEKLS